MTLQKTGPIVAFSINATIGIFIVAFEVSYNGVLKNESIVGPKSAY